MPADTWIIYAVGGGWGHLTRALAVARVAAKKHSVKIIANSIYIESVIQSPNWIAVMDKLPIEIIDLRRMLATDSSAIDFALCIKNILIETEYSTLIVDTFARGILGELVDILPVLKQKLRVFVHRDLKPDYVEKFRLREFVIANFDLILNPGEGTSPPLADLAQLTPPWLLLEDCQLASSTGVLESMHLNPSCRGPLILFCASGQSSELSDFTQLCHEIANEHPSSLVRCIGVERQFESSCGALFLNYWPGINCINVADLVISSGGYNIMNECKALGVPLIVMPKSRLYDRQSLRAKSSNLYIASNLNELKAGIEDILKSDYSPDAPRRIRQQTRFENGANAAVALIEQHSRQSCLLESD